jgi:hypothetical protein
MSNLTESHGQAKNSNYIKLLYPSICRDRIPFLAVQTIDRFPL